MQTGRILAPAQLGCAKISGLVPAAARTPARSAESSDGESRAGSLPFGYSDCAVQPVQRGGGDPLQQAVVLDHLLPPSLLERGRKAVFGRDARLRVIPG
jgi:hypothetical protein